MRAKNIFSPIFFFILIFGGTLLLPYIALRDATSPSLFSEFSVTEILQESFLFFSMLIFFFIAFKDKGEGRSIQILVGSAMAIMLIREFDFFFDSFIHGLWKLPAFLVLISSLVFVFRKFSVKSILSSTGSFLRGSHFPTMLFAMNTILVFSRIAGKRSLWRTIFKGVDQNVNNSVEPIVTAAKHGIDMSDTAMLQGRWLADASNNWSKTEMASEIKLRLGDSELMEAGTDFPSIEIAFGHLKTFVEETCELYGFYLLLLASLNYYITWMRSMCRR